jgi:hypothetical protein
LLPKNVQSRCLGAFNLFLNLTLPLEYQLSTFSQLSQRTRWSKQHRPMETCSLSPEGKKRERTPMTRMTDVMSEVAEAGSKPELSEVEPEPSAQGPGILRKKGLSSFLSPLPLAQSAAWDSISPQIPKGAPPPHLQHHLLHPSSHCALRLSPYCRNIDQ